MKALKLYTRSSCPNSPAARAICREIAAEMNIGFIEEELNAENNTYVPTIIYNDKVLFKSEVPDKFVIIEAIKKLKKGDRNGE